MNTKLFWLNENIFWYRINIIHRLQIYFDWIIIYCDITLKIFLQHFSNHIRRLNDFFYICNDLVNENYFWKDGLQLTNESLSFLLNDFINNLNQNVNKNIWPMTKGCDIENNIDIKENPVQVAKKVVLSLKNWFLIQKAHLNQIQSTS